MKLTQAQRKILAAIYAHGPVISNLPSRASGVEPGRRVLATAFFAKYACPKTGKKNKIARTCSIQSLLDKGLVEVVWPDDKAQSGGGIDIERDWCEIDMTPAAVGIMRSSGFLARLAMFEPPAGDRRSPARINDMVRRQAVIDQSIMELSFQSTNMKAERQRRVGFQFSLVSKSE